TLEFGPTLDGLFVSVFDHIMMEIIFRFFSGIRLDNITVRPDLNLAIVFTARQVTVGVDLVAATFEIVSLNDDEGHVGVFGSKMLSLFGAAGVHDGRKGMLDRVGQRNCPAQAIVAAIKIKCFVACPQALEYLKPLRGLIISVVVFAHGGTEHFQFGPIPAGDDIKTESTACNMIDRGAL